MESAEGRMKTRSALPVVAALLGWFALTVGAFWRLEWQYLRPVARPPGGVQAHPDTLPPSPVLTLATDQGILPLDKPGQVIWLNVWNPDCPCSRYAEARVQRLAAKFARRGVRLITLVECGASAREQQDALAAWHKRGSASYPAAADPQGRIARQFGVWAAPAAIILNRQGQCRVRGRLYTPPASATILLRRGPRKPSTPSRRIAARPALPRPSTAARYPPPHQTNCNTLPAV